MLAVLSTGFVACNLDRYPTSSVAQETSMSTYNDAVAWDKGMMATLRARRSSTRSGSNSSTNDLMLVPDIQADELNATLAYGNNYGAPHDWVNFRSSTYEVRDTYGLTYKALNDINFIITKMPALEASLTDATQKAAVGQILGRAYFIRAHYYLELAIRFGKAYDASTAASDRNAPLILEYNPKARPANATNKEMYAQILADLAEASTRLSGATGTANATTITIDAVKALKARVALYMQDWATALSTAKELISSGTYALMDASKDNMTAMWRADGETLKESIVLLPVSWPDEWTATSPTYLYPQVKTHRFIPYYLPTQGIIDLYDDSDTRKAVYFSKDYDVEIEAEVYSKTLTLITKFWGNPSLASTKDATWGVVPDYRMRPKLYRLAEQYLIAAEAAYRSGNSSDALTLLNALRKSRGLADVSVSGDALWTEIKKERQRELAFEGFRLFDLKRWGLAMTRMTPQTINGTSPFLVADHSKLTMPATDHRFVWPIPFQDVQLNPNLKQADGY